MLQNPFFHQTFPLKKVLKALERTVVIIVKNYCWGGERKGMSFVMDYLKFLHFEYNYIFSWKHGDMGLFRGLYKIKVNIEK